MLVPRGLPSVSLQRVLLVAPLVVSCWCALPSLFERLRPAFARSTAPGASRASSTKDHRPLRSGQRAAVDKTADADPIVCCSASGPYPHPTIATCLYDAWFSWIVILVGLTLRGGRRRPFASLVVERRKGRLAKSPQVSFISYSNSGPWPNMRDLGRARLLARRLRSASSRR